MNKKELIQFIKKYNLGGLVESVKCNIKDNQLSTKFMLSDNTLLGIITLKEFNYNDNIEFSLYNTEKLLKVLTTLDDEIDIDFNIIHDKTIYIKIFDSRISAKYMLAENSIIHQAKELAELPDFEIKLEITDYIIDKFIKSSNALSDSQTFYIERDDLEENTKIIINDDNNKITINIDTIEAKEISNMPKFDINKFREMLLNNKDSEKRLLYLSSKGIMKLEFDSKLFSSTYYLVANAL